LSLKPSRFSHLIFLNTLNGSFSSNPMDSYIISKSASIFHHPHSDKWNACPYIA
jgi:hypothetical protein